MLTAKDNGHADEDFRESTTAMLLGMRDNPADQDVWARFAERYVPIFYKWARGHGLNSADAEDVTQEILHRLHRIALRTYERRPGVRARAWLRAIAANKVNDWCRSLMRRRERTGSEADWNTMQLVEARESLLERLNAEYDRERLEEAETAVRKRVEVTTWRCYELTKKEGRTVREASESLAISEAAVQKNAHRVYEHLCQEIASDKSI